MSESSFAIDLTDGLHDGIFSARMEKAENHTGSEVTVYIDEPHQILGKSMPIRSGYSFSARQHTKQEGSFGLTPRGHTVPGISVYFEADGWGLPVKGSMVWEGQVLVHLEKGSEAVSKADTTKQSVDDGGSTRKEGQRD